MGTHRILVLFVTVMFINGSSIVHASQHFQIVDDRVFYREVIEVPSFTRDEIIDHFESLLSVRSTTNRMIDKSGTIMLGGIGTAGLGSDTQSIINQFNSSNTVEIQENTIRTGVLQIFLSEYLTSPQLILVWSKIRIDVKDGRYRFTISDFSYQHRMRKNPYGNGEIPFSTKGTFDFTPRVNCEGTGALYTLTLCDKPKKNLSKSMELISADLNDLLTILRSEIKRSTEEEDW